MRRRTLSASLAALLLLCLPRVLAAQASGVLEPARILGPPAPVAPEVINRDDRGNATVRGVRLAERPRLDGILDEGWYRDVPPISGFIQSLPDEGAPATEQTEVWIGFDDVNIYISARVWNSAPEREWVVTDVRRDGSGLRQNEQFGVMFDTFYDRRNGVTMYTNPLGALADVAITNEGSPNSDWNPIWDVRTGRFEGGWTVEMEIPFRSLRYRPGREQVWGIQLRRAARNKNEWSNLTLVPAAATGSGPQGGLRVSAAGTLVGLEAPPQGRSLELKPYGISGLRTNRLASPAVSNDLYGDVGLDVKYGITQNLTADFTLNTDFAQVEVDEQQVNLTRFDVSFPEKRDFFLEGPGIFEFAPRPGSPMMRGPPNNAPSIFFSRRIGLHEGEPVPILAGTRMTGKVGPFDVGALAVQTDAHGAGLLPSTTFTAARLRRDVLSRSAVGAMVTSRSRSTLGEGSAQTFGVDGSFSLLGDLNLVAYAAGTRAPGLAGDNLSYQARLNYDADRYGLILDHLLVGREFNPEVGFLRRSDFRQTQGMARFSPRPRTLEAVRKLTFELTGNHLEGATTGAMESRERRFDFQAELESSDNVSFGASDQREVLALPFRIAPDVFIAPGAYAFQDVQVGYDLGAQRRLSGSFSAQWGSFYGGTRTSIGFNRGRLTFSPRLFLEPTVSLNWVELEDANFATHLLVSRLTYGVSPRMFASGLVQYNSATRSFGTNLRLRWEYAPGSELFVVYTDDRVVEGDVFDRAPALTNRGLVLKVTRMFRP